MRRLLLLAALLVAASAVAASASLVCLPLRTVGVSDTTAAVVGDLLQGELEGHGVTVIPASRLGAELAAGEAACDDADCAAAAARRCAASRVVYGSLSRLGGKIIVRIRALRVGEAAPYYVEQIAATAEEDLDAVVRRIADGIATGRANSDRATVETVTEAETLEPRRRASRSGVGLRAGFLFPAVGSYGETDRLTSLRLAYRHETRDYLIETTPMLGFAWRGGTVEWSIFDLFGARLFGVGDLATYVGAGLGVHSLRVTKKETVRYNGSVSTYETSRDQSETTLTTDVGVGLFALRTYDFSIVVDLRYHYVFADFDDLGGKGAHGVALTFGTSR